MPDIHICYGVDKTYFELCLISISQIILHRHPYTDLHFHIIVDDKSCMNDPKVALLNDLPHVDIEMVYRDSSAYVAKDTNRTNDYLSNSTVLRYIVPSLESLKDVPRAIYLDADTVVLADLGELLNYPLHGNIVGMCKNPVRIVQDRMINYIFDPVDKQHFFNAGIMLMDLTAMRTINFTELCRLHALSSKEQDEPVLNMLLEDQIQPLPPVYDVPYSMMAEHLPHTYDVNVFNMYYNTRFATLHDFLQYAKILHFLGNKELFLANDILPEIFKDLRLQLNMLIGQRTTTGLIQIQPSYFIDKLFHK